MLYFFKLSFPLWTILSIMNLITTHKRLYSTEIHFSESSHSSALFNYFSFTFNVREIYNESYLTE